MFLLLRSKEELSKLKELKQQRLVAIKHHDFYLEKRGPIHAESRTFPVPYDAKLRKKKKYKKALKEHRVDKILELTPLFNETISISFARDNFYVLCKDGTISIRDPIHDSKLVCRFQHHADPYLRLAPFKMEEVSADPFVVVFYEIMYEEEMNQLKSRAAPNLMRSEFGGVDASTKKGECLFEQ